jgi:hypothetical protein
MLERWWWVMVLALVLASCGPRASNAGGTTVAEGAPVVSGDPTDGGRRRALENAQCDYGGAADLTCQRGLFCCYGPPDNPGDFGQCMIECPQY